MQNLDQIARDAETAFAATSDPDTLEQIKARFLGKSGQITELLKGLGKMSPDERKLAGAAINRAKEAIESALNSRREALRCQALEARLAQARPEGAARLTAPKPMPAAHAQSGHEDVSAHGGAH